MKHLISDERRAHIKKQRAEHYCKNREKERENCRLWYAKHKESEIAKNAEYRKQNRELFDWYHNKNRYSGLREEALEQDNKKCKLCEADEEKKLVVHHIDGNGYYQSGTNAHNELSNFIILCKQCHSALHKWQQQKRILTSREDIVRTLGKPKERNHYGVIRKSFLYGE